MAECCCPPPLNLDSHRGNQAYRRVLWAVLAINAVMFLVVIGAIVWHTMHGTLPSAFTMGTVGLAALVANAASFGLLWAYRTGDANMRSAWVAPVMTCSATWLCCSPRLAFSGRE